MSETTCSCINLKSLKLPYPVRVNPEERLITDDPWYFEVVLSRGRVWPHGISTLQAFTSDRAGRARLRKLPFVTPHQTGDEEMVVTFPYTKPNLSKVIAALTL